MPKKLTPIERHIAGEPGDRRRRYDAKMRAQGFKRVALTVREQDVELWHEIAACLREDPSRIDQLLQAVHDASDAPGRAAERPQRSEDAPATRQERRAAR